MKRTDGRLIEWVMPLLFILLASYVIWNFPRFIISFGWGDETGAVYATNPPASIIDFIALLLLPISFVVGAFTIRTAAMEYPDWSGFDRISLFIGRITMMIILIIVIVMTYEVFVRYVLEKPTTTFIVLFAIALIYGAYGEASQKLLRWETFGTAFDPPLPATLKPMLLLVMTLVAVQAIVNLFADWNKEPEIHTDEPDAEEIEALRSTLKD